MATLKSNLNINTSLVHNFSYSLQNSYTEIFEVTQQVDNNDDYINIATFTPNSKAAQSLEGAELIVLNNPSDQVMEVRIAYENWEGTTSATVDTNDASPDSSYICQLLRPNEYLMLPNIHAVGYDTAKAAAEGTAVSNATPDSNLWVDSTANLAEKVEDTSTDFDVTDGDFFRVGDLIQIGINETTATKKEIMKVTAISGANLTVERALHGTAAADGDTQTNATNGAVSGANVHFPIFNAKYDYNKATLGSTQLVATDGKGDYRSKNFFGYGRAAVQEIGGLTKGSVCLKFYSKAYQEFTFSIPITSSTDSKLTAGNVYGVKMTFDGATEQEVPFTVDSSNTRFGGRNGIIDKINSAFAVQAATNGVNLFGYKVTASIVNGKLRFTSGQNLVASSVSISQSSTAAAANGYINDAGIFAGLDFDAKVDPSLPADTVQDKDGISRPNLHMMLMDDGYGRLISPNPALGSGTIDYNTGAISIVNSLPHAQFVVSANTQASLSGGPIANTCIASIKARSTSAKRYGTVQLIAFN